MFISNPWNIFLNLEEKKIPSVKEKETPSISRGYNNQIIPNAGNFQEYTYELEWMECDWKIVYKVNDLVTAFWYPWIRYPSSN